MKTNVELSTQKSFEAARLECKHKVSNFWLASFSLSCMVSVFAACGGNGNKETAVTDCPTAPTTFSPNGTVSTTQATLTGPSENVQVASLQLVGNIPPANPVVSNPPTSTTSGSTTGSTAGNTTGTTTGTTPATQTQSTETSTAPAPAAAPEKTDPPCTGFCTSNQAAAQQFGTEGTQAASQANKDRVDAQRNAMATEQASQNNLTPCTPPANFQPTTLNANEKTGQTNARADNAVNNGGGSPTANPIGGLSTYGQGVQANASVTPQQAQTNANQTIDNVSTSSPIPQTSSRPEACEKTGSGLSAGSGSEITGGVGASSDCKERKGNTNF